MKLTRTTCPYCGVGCGVLAAADGTIKGDPEHPANYGRLCSKGSALGETIDLDGRLLYPQIHGQRASWDAALDLMALRFSAAIDEYGPDSVAFYVSGQLLTEDYYVANKLMKGYIGSANIDTNSRLCMASSVAGHKRAFGTDTVPGTYEDLELADLIVLVGSNLAWCHPVLYQRIAAAKAKRPEMRVVNIDPRRTATSDLADLHLAIRSDGDVALFNGLLAHLYDTGAVDQAFLDSHVDGADAALAAARATDTADTNLSADELAQFYRLWAQTKRVVTVYSQGVNQSASGTDKVNAILNCHLATGRIGHPGMGPFSVTGQPNAMGGREVGGLANMLGWHLDIENEDHQAAVQSAWGSPTICTKPGLKAVDLFDACADGRIKALWIMSTNPAVSLPDANRVAEAIRTVPFVVVSDIMKRTDTGDLADVLLPAAAWGEKSGTVTNSERRISRQRPFLPPPGEALPDWQILCLFAEVMGWKRGFGFEKSAEIFAEYAQLSQLAKAASKDFDITGLAQLSDAEYDNLIPVQWPVPDDKSAGGRFFGDGQFFTPTGRGRMVAVKTPDQADSAPGTYTLNTGRVRDHWHTMTRTGKSRRLSQHLAEPFVELHPEDAVALGLRDAELARLEGHGGTMIARVLITPKIAPGSAFVPMHWTAQTSPAGRSNPLVAPRTDPVSGQPALKGSAVRIRPFKAAWYGFAASATAMEPNLPYSAVARTNTGWQLEMAGTETPPDWAKLAIAITGAGSSTPTVMEDRDKALIRIAFLADSQITALFFAAPHPVAASRRHVTSLIGTNTCTQMALAGRPAGGLPDPGALVCSCMNVGLNTLRTAITGGANTVDSLGTATGAGTSCGSCRPELAALIAAAKPMAAE